MFEKKSILGVLFDYASQNEVLEYIYKSLLIKAKKFYIITPNPELVVLARHRENYRKILNNAGVSVPDGIGIILAGKILGISLKEKIAGVDLMEKICKRIAKKPVTAGFLGGEGHIAERTAECLKKQFPGLKVSFFGENINNFSKFPPTDILFVAFGSPKQEIWISEYINKLPVKVMMGVGGAFDMVSGNVKRAPKRLRDIGLEWLYRLISQPWRAKRQLALFEFLLLIVWEKLFKL